VKLADDFVVDYQRVHEIVWKIVEAGAPRFSVDFRGPWIINVIRITPT